MPSYDFEIRDSGDNGEFLTWATVVLLQDGQEVERHELWGSSEEPGPDAVQQASSLGCSWVESMETPLEVRLAPFGPEWEREQADRYSYDDVPF